MINDGKLSIHMSVYLYNACSCNVENIYLGIWKHQKTIDIGKKI